MRNAYLAALYDLAKHDKNVLALVSDNGAIVYDKFREDFPNQYMNFGIAEANMIAAAAGMASRGKIPFAYTIGAFLAYRALEFIRNDVCYQRQNIKIVGTGAGFAYASLGATHHVTEDISILRAMPNLTLFSPASPLEVKKVVQTAYEMDTPCYIRIGTNKEPEIYEKDYDFVVGKAVTLREGKDITLMSTGAIASEVLKAADELTTKGYSVRVLNFPTIKPLDKEAICRAAEETKHIVTVEEHSIYGGFGGATAEVLAESGIGAKFRRVGLRDFAQGYGTHGEVAAANGVSARKIVGVCERLSNSTKWCDSMTKKYFSVDYNGCKNKSMEYIQGSMDAFQKETGIQMSILPLITEKAIDNLLNTTSLLYQTDGSKGLEVLLEEILWKNMVLDEKVSMFKQYLDKLDVTGDELIITDPYIFPNKCDSEYEELLARILGCVDPSKITIVTVESHMNKILSDKIINTIDVEIQIKYSEDFHDRFWLSRKSLKCFVVGTSMNGIGNKISSIQFLDDVDEDIKKIIYDIDNLNLP